MFPTATTNVAVQPAFSVVPAPTSVPLNPAGASGTNLAPSAMALNSVKGYAVITEQATSTLQLIDLTGTDAGPGGQSIFAGLRRVRPQLPHPRTLPSTISCR